MAKIKWNKNPLQETLKQYIIDGKISTDMKPAAMQKTRPEYEAMGKLFASHLKGMHDAISKEGNARNKAKKEDKWCKKNLVRQLMEQDVATSVIPDTMPITMAWELWPEYKAIKDFDLFKTQLVSMQSIVSVKKERAARDAQDLAHDLAIHPHPKYNYQGEVQWIKSEAKVYLEMDIKDGKHNIMTPQQLFLSCPEYSHNCPILEVFCGHMYQQIKIIKWRNQWVDRKKEYTLVSLPFDQ